jgi:hypothetical protein
MAAGAGFLGGALVIGASFVPTRLGSVYRVWMGLARLLSRITTPIFMAIVYFLIITPAGIVMRIFGYTPLRRESGQETFWITREPAHRRSDMRRQF